MLKNWILISFRRFNRNKTNSLINLLGLTLGMTVFFLIFIYVRHEFSYDSFHTEANRVYRIIKENPPGNNYMSNPRQAVLPGPLANVIRQQVTGVDALTRMSGWGNLTVETSETNKYFIEDSFTAADGDLFRILTFESIAGQTDKALQQPYTVALSEKTAIKYFGRTDVVGEVLNLTGYKSFGRYTIDLVFRDFPTHSSYDFKVVLRFEDFIKTVQPSDLENWNNWNYNYLLKTSDGVAATTVAKQIDDFFLSRDKANAESEGKSTYYLQPLSEFYLRSNINFSNTPRNDINRLYLLSVLAVFILVVAGINYVNLTTARSIKRAKEVGVRKVVGALPTNLVMQFLSDALLLSFGSLLLALAATWALFPVYRDFIGKQIGIDLLHDPTLVLMILFIPLALGLLAGLYPSFALSAFKPVRVLKGNFSTSSEGSLLRDGLTVFQFAISGALIIAVLVVTSQLNYLEHHDPGYDREQILRLNIRDEGVSKKRDVLINELRKNPNILNISVASYFPNQVNTQQSRNWKSAAGSIEVSFYTIHADPNYLDVFNIKLVDGRNFIPGNPADSSAFLINETAAQTYGWANPVGMQFTGESTGNKRDTATIIGVIKDIHIADYRHAIAPFRIGFVNSWASTLAIKINPKDIPATLLFIEDNYKKLATTKMPFAITFFDEDFGKVYKADRQMGTLIYLFSLVAVLIACLGLYGLTMHTINIRLKEIGIRKVLGAEMGQLIFMLARKFVVLILVSFVLATPVSYFFMNDWLQNFVYHTDISISSFIIAVLMLMLIALATVSGQVWRATLSKPTEVLRSE
jgi:putative ABC transport system permease protein